MSIMRGKTAEEWAQKLTKSDKVASAGNMYRYLGWTMYSSKGLILARKISCENKKKDKQDKIDKAKEKEIAL